MTLALAIPVTRIYMKNFLFLVLLFSIKSFAFESFNQTCHVIGEDDYVQFQIEIEHPIQIGSIFNLKMTAFEDENCSIPYLKYNQYFIVDLLQADRLNLKTLQVTYTTLSDEVSEALNMIQYCGSLDWKTSSEMIVTGKVCDEFQQLATNQSFFQIFKRNGDQISLGQIDHLNDGRLETKRPYLWDEFGFTKIFSKPSLHVNSIHLE